MKKLLWTALVLLFVLIPLSASAETANIDIGEANWLDIMPGGYTMGGAASGATDSPEPEHPFTGNYVISGSTEFIDTAIDFYNYSGQPVVYNVTFKDLRIMSRDWATAIRFNGDSDIILNIINIGDTRIYADGHPAFGGHLENNAKLNISVINTFESKFTCGNGNIGDKVYDVEYDVTFTVNNRPVPGDERLSASQDIHEWVYPIWSPDVSDPMTEESFLNNAHGVSCTFTCVCLKQAKVTELQPTINGDGTGTYTAHLAESEPCPGATASITYTLVEEPLPPATDLPATDMPATGDSARLLLWSAMLAASVVALLTMRKTSRAH